MSFKPKKKKQEITLAQRTGLDHGESLSNPAKASFGVPSGASTYGAVRTAANTHI